MKVCPTGQYGITFDDLCNAPINVSFVLPTGYASINWTNTGALAPQTCNLAFLRALSSGSFIGFNRYGNPMSISILPRSFDFNSLIISAAYKVNLTVMFLGTTVNNTSLNRTFIVHTSTATHISLNWTNMTEVKIKTPANNGSDHFSVDNLCLRLN